jgi:hypothetical protein
VGASGIQPRTPLVRSYDYRCWGDHGDPGYDHDWTSIRAASSVWTGVKAWAAAARGASAAYFVQSRRQVGEHLASQLFDIVENESMTDFEWSHPGMAIRTGAELQAARRVAAERFMAIAMMYVPEGWTI